MPGPPKGQALRPALDRFTEKWLADGSGCWIWTSRRNNRGYGVFYLDGTMRLAHRASYTLHVGDIPDGLVIDHICNQPACVNPSHLTPTTQRHNVRRAVADKPTCVNGHAMTDDTVGVRSLTGWKFCRICKRERERLRRLEVVA